MARLVGEVLPINELMAALDIACSSSENERFPNVLGESMACGVPCVATDVGNSAWIVGAMGLAVPPEDLAALAAACRALMQEARRRLSAGARARVAREFSLARVVSKYEAVQTEVLEPREHR